KPCGFGHENILHHQMLQARQGVAGMVQVGVTHRGVFAHDVHAANLVRITVRGQCLVHDFHHGVAGLVIKLGTPKIFKPRVGCFIGHALVVGEHHRYQARIAGTLDVVLAAQRMEADPGLPICPVTVTKAIKQRALSVP
ncbi:MAG: hypothetical protein RLZZ454_1, partial [Pseudomonadota bacterium]